jgi:hypothetical protein
MKAKPHAERLVKAKAAKTHFAAHRQRRHHGCGSRTPEIKCMSYSLGTISPAREDSNDLASAHQAASLAARAICSCSLSAANKAEDAIS